MPDTLIEQTTFRRRLFHSVSLPLGIMAILTLLLVWQISNLLRASQWVEHTDQVISQAHGNLDLLVDMETGMRGYLVSGKTVFLEPYDRAIPLFPADFAALQQLATDNPQQVQRLTALHTTFEQWNNYARTEIALRRDGKNYLAAFDTVTGKRLMDSLRGQFHTFIRTEERLRQERSTNARLAANLTLAFALGLALILGIVLTIVRRNRLVSLVQSYEEALRLSRELSAVLQASEAQLSTTLHSIGDAMIATDAQGKVTLLNPMAEQLTGWTQAEAKGKDLHEVFVIVHEETRQQVESPVEKVIRTGGSVDLAKRTSVIARKGTETSIEDTAAPILDAQGNLSGVVLVFRDIMERKQAEIEQARLAAQLFQSQKMEGLGRLAGGIAHDYNNLLAIILGYAELMEDELAAENGLQLNLYNIQSAAKRAAALTGQLLTFSRQDPPRPKVISVNSLIKNMTQMLKPLIGADVEMVVLLDEGDGAVLADANQLEQVIVNLVVNGRDAMPTGGRLIVQTESVHLRDMHLSDTVRIPPGDYMLVSVTDTGMGMSEEVKARIFEPFFTTKASGKGTGLGLTTCYSIVLQADGTLWVDSEVGVGTTMKVYLPQVNTTPVVFKEAATPLVGGSERVLVVEDEPLVRELTAATLRRHGYTVLEAENGAEAVRVMEAADTLVHLVITDAIMPLMGGRELIGRLRALSPETRVLMASGYSEGEIVLPGTLPAGVEFLQKPFTQRALLERVRLVLLDGRATGPGSHCLPVPAPSHAVISETFAQRPLHPVLLP